MGLIAVLVGITYGIQPYGVHTMGWSNPWVLAAVIGGALVLVLSAIGRGGLMFILIIWLQGIWLPRHGYSFVDTPLWAGIYMLPLTAGFLVAGPISGAISDKHGARLLATGGMVVAALSFGWLLLLPVNFAYWTFALALLLNGIGMGLFAAPNRAGIMNALPPNRRGVGAGMSTTFQNSAMVLSIGFFFLMVTGLARTLPATLNTGLMAHGVSAADAAFLTGRGFFPTLISGPFADGLAVAFGFAIVACLVAAVASALRGGKYAYGDGDELVASAGRGSTSTARVSAPLAIPETARATVVAGRHALGSGYSGAPRHRHGAQ